MARTGGEILLVFETMDLACILSLDLTLERFEAIGLTFSDPASLTATLQQFVNSNWKQLEARSLGYEPTPEELEGDLQLTARLRSLIEKHHGRMFASTLLDVWLEQIFRYWSPTLRYWDTYRLAIEHWCETSASTSGLDRLKAFACGRLSERLDKRLQLAKVDRQSLSAYDSKLLEHRGYVVGADHAGSGPSPANRLELAAERNRFQLVWEALLPQLSGPEEAELHRLGLEAHHRRGAEDVASFPLPSTLRRPSSLSEWDA